jgi:CO/xanthine dehydrogenase Mo-binding subunit
MKTNRWISGIGEKVVPLVAPAILNAIHMATVNAYARECFRVLTC